MEILFVIPGDINLPTGGYRYDRRLIAEWRRAGHKVILLSLLGDYPFPNVEDKKNALALASSAERFDHCIVDGLAGGAHPLLIEKLSESGPVTALIHHPLCLENGLSLEAAEQLKKTEKEGLEFISRIITTSPETARTVKSLFNIGGLSVNHVYPGTERNQTSRPAETENLKLLCVGSVIERKGHKYLIRALSGLKHLNWKLDCVGKTDIDPGLYQSLLKLVESENLPDRIDFHGAVDDASLLAMYSNADIFVLPSLYEGYGMVYAEAISFGLPIVGTTAGAIPDTVPQGCGILVEPANVSALGDALAILIDDEERRHRCRQESIAAATALPTWKQSATKFLKLLEQNS